MPSFASHDGTEMAFDVTGSGPAAVLHHGFAADAATNWVLPGIVDALVTSGRQVVTLDARGHGRSGKPHDPVAYQGLTMVQDVQGLLDHLELDAVDMVGYSMGSIVTAALLVEEPRVRSGVLGGMGARFLARPGSGDSPLPFDAIADALEADDPSTIRNAEARGFREFADVTGADRLALAAIQRSRLAALPDLSTITVPVLVIAGDADDLIGDPAGLAAAIPGSITSIISGDHLTAVFDPRLAEEIVSFLRTASPTSPGAVEPTRS